MCCGSVETSTAVKVSWWRQRHFLTASLLIGMTIAVPSMSRASGDAAQEFTAAIHARPSSMHGEALFNDTCIACHGPDGGGQADGSVPAIAGQPSRVIVRQVVDFRHGRRWDLRMEHSTGRHRLVDAQDIADVADYVSRLPSTQTSNTGSGQSLAAGQLLYTRSCATCHGDSGSADASREIPRLAGQHYRYLLEQMQDAIAGQRPAFPPEHVLLLQRLAPDDLVAVADYLSRLASR